MSDFNVISTIQARRDADELNRLRATLSDRNQQLQTTEQQLNNSQINYKYSQRNVRMFMVICVVLVLALVLGGVK